MALRPILSLLATASAGLAGPLTSRGDGDSIKPIKWGDCEFEFEDPVECGSLDVPLDYTDPEGEKLSLSLAKVPAVHTPSKGSILMNFGGPGGEAVGTLGMNAPLLLNVTGGHHDLVAFDPRGTGKTMPLSCFEEQEDREAYQEQTILMYDESDTAPDEIWENASIIAQACEETMEGGELVGTAFVARDLMQTVDALDEDGLLRYWGISYGTVLGATVANMFPDRMDRLVLDGVANEENYYHGFHIDADQMTDADAAWLAFLGECISAGEKCAIADLNSTAGELADTLSRAAERYHTDPVAVGDKVLTYSAVKILYYLVLKNANDLSYMTNLIRNIVTGENLSDVAEYVTSLGAAAESEALPAIACGDTLPRAESREGVVDEAEHMLDVSKNFGGVQQFVSMTCAQWPFEAKERRPIDGSVKTANPALFVGNTYDVATAVDSAYKMSERFPGSVVVEQKGFGHGSIAQESKCTWKAIADYFIDGILPDGNIECEVDVELFQ